MAEIATETITPTTGVTRYHLPDGHRLTLVSEGRLVSLTGPASQGHPAKGRDTTFAMQFEAGRDLLDTDLSTGPYAVPDRLDRAVAERTLKTLGATIDGPTTRQREYAADWRAGF